MQPPDDRLALPQARSERKPSREERSRAEGYERPVLNLPTKRAEVAAKRGSACHAKRNPAARWTRKPPTSSKLNSPAHKIALDGARKTHAINRSACAHKSSSGGSTWATHTP